MHIALLSTALVCLALPPSLPGEAGAARASRPDAWTALPENIPPFSRTPDISSDSAGNVYFRGHEGVFLLEDGRLRALPLPDIAGFRPWSFLPRSEREYWVGMAGPGPDGKTQSLLFHYRSGHWARYDSGTACSRGVQLGLDAAGNLILELRTGYAFSSTSQGVFRLVDGECQAIPLGLEINTEKMATRYYRDKRGREYFGLEILSDAPGCAGLLRLGDTLERFETIELEPHPLGTYDPTVPLCVRDFAESGDTVFLATGGGFAVLVDTTLQLVGRIHGARVVSTTQVLRDSRGFLWVAAVEGTPTSAPLGLFRIKGSDTTLVEGYDSLRSRLRELWEDKDGNIWVDSEEGGYAVHLREGNPLPLSLAPRRHRSRPGPRRHPVWERDFLGRKAHPARRPAIRVRTGA